MGSNECSYLASAVTVTLEPSIENDEPGRGDLTIRFKLRDEFKSLDEDPERENERVSIESQLGLDEYLAKQEARRQRSIFRNLLALLETTTSK